MFRVGDHMLSIQAHPEFLKAYTQALMEDRIERIGKQVVENGISSLEMNLDVDVFRRWVINFFRSE
jgi:GMP synthase-like glutamine amidotransferase